MNYYKANPSVVLSMFIKNYWQISSNSQIKHIERVIPNGLANISFYLSDLPKINDQNRGALDIANIVGLQNQYFDIIINGNFSLFNIALTPLGIRYLFNINPEDFLNANIPLKYFFGGISELEDKLYSSTNFNRRVQLTENFIIKNLLKKVSEFELKRDYKTLQFLNSTTEIKKLASQLYLSERQFYRNFMKNIGMSPKKFQNIIKFQNCLYNRQTTPSISMTKLTYESNFFDQSHMNKLFKIYSGYSPKQFFGICEPYSDYYAL